MLFSLDHAIELEQQLFNLGQKIETQKEKLKRLQDNIITGNLNTDSKLAMKEISDLGNSFKFYETRYFLDDQEIATAPAIFVRFIKNGNHILRIEKKYGYNYKIFTYMNVKRYHLVKQIEFTLKPGHTTYLNIALYKTDQEKSPLDLNIENKLVVNTEKETL